MKRASTNTPLSLQQIIKPERLDSKAAASYLGLAEYTLRRSRTTGKLGGTDAPPFRKLGKKVLYDLADLEVWLTSLGKHQHTASFQAKA